MNKTFSLKQRSKRGNPDTELLPRQHKPDLMARFMETETINPGMKQKEIAKELGYSNSTLQRYRQDMKLQIPHKSISPTFLRNVK